MICEYSLLMLMSPMSRRDPEEHYIVMWKTDIMCPWPPSPMEKPESDVLRKKSPNMDLEKIKSIRKAEFLESARILGVEPIMLGFDDNFALNPLTTDKQE